MLVAAAKQDSAVGGDLSSWNRPEMSGISITLTSRPLLVCATSSITLSFLFILSLEIPAESSAIIHQYG